MSQYERRQRLKKVLLDFMKPKRKGVPGLTGRGLAQILDDLAKDSDARVSPGAVQGWLNGSSYPNKENREFIAAALGMSYEALQAKLEDRAIAAEAVRPVDEICRAIHSLPRADLPHVARALTERMIEELDVSQDLPK
jgi:transcriptional regulator with XRE-family HTH domain